MFRRKDRIEIKTPAQIEVMRAAGLVVGRTLEALRQAVAPGVTTGHLDAIARDYLATHGATSSFLGYYGYPAVICASVNDEIVHGIPGNRVLNDGDQISIDFGAIIEGWNGDAAITVPVGSVSPELEELSRVTEASMWAGLSAALVGGVLNDIGSAVEATIRSAPAGQSYGIVQEYVGPRNRLEDAYGAERPQLRSQRQDPNSCRGNGLGHRTDGVRRLSGEPHAR